MSDFILTEQPLWFVVFCLLAGFGYAYILYRRDRKLSELSSLIRKLMFALRFLSVSIIAFLLLAPLLNILSKTTEKPLIVLAHDNSESLKDFVNDGYLEQYRTLQQKLSEHFDTRNLLFGDKISDTATIDFSYKQTDISQVLDESYNKFYNRNIGAVILASDGIYNKGSNPVYSASEFNFPVYTVALGDTGIRRDAGITGVNHNKIAFLNNEFPVQVSISAKKMRGQTARLTVSDNGKVLHNQIIRYNSDDFFSKENFILKAEKSGVRRITVDLEYLDDEYSKQNNRKEVIIEVIDSKQKILILADAPHPDIGAIRRAVETNANYEADFIYLNKFKGSASDYDLVVMYQLPSVKTPVTKLPQFIKNGSVPALYILGEKTRCTEFNRLNAGMTIAHIQGSYDIAQASVNSGFNLFQLNPNIESLFKSAPPLKVPYGETKSGAGSEVLIYQKLKNIPTEKPLIVINNNNTSGREKSAVIAGEGIWQWAVQDYKQNKNHALFNELINKTVQFLTLKAKKERFRVNSEKIISENQEVKFSAERYNKSYELITDEEVKLTFADSTGREYNYVFNKTGKSYKLNIGAFSPGRYYWTAETKTDGKTEVIKGETDVAEINIEAENVTANHSVLKKIADETGGYMFNAKTIDAVYDSILNNPNIKPVSYTEKKTESLLSNIGLLIVILILLSAEWFLRKFYGTI